MNDFQTGNTLTNVFNSPAGTENPSKTGFVFASRKLGTGNKIILPLGGETMPSPYIPFKLSAYKNGTSALAALAKKGFKFVLGSRVSSTLVAPDSVINNNTNGTVDLVWNSSTTGLENLAGTNPTGSVIQGTTDASASIKTILVGANITTMTVVMVNGSNAFNTVNEVTVNAVLSSPAPDPAQSDQVCVFAYWYYQMYAVSPQFTTSPDLWISTLIEGVNTSISPQSAPINLVAPTSVALLSDGSYNLTYSVTADNLGLLPTQYFGSTTVTQDTITGTYNGYTISGSNVIINVTNPTGAFNATDTISIALDVARNGGTLTDKTEISGVAMCYPVHDTTTLNSTYADFVGLIASFREPTQVRNNKFNVIGYYGYVPQFIGQYPLSAYTAPDTQAFCATIKGDIPTAFQYPCNNVVVVAQSMFTDMNNDPPFEASVGEGSPVNMTISSNRASWFTDEQCNQLVNQGWTVVGYTAEGTGYWFQRVCTYQTQSGNVDMEYRYMSLQGKVRWLDKNIELANRRATINPNTGQRRNNNPIVVTNVQNGGTDVLNTAQSLGIVGTIGNKVTAVIEVGEDVTRIRETVTTTIVPQNNGVDAIVYINSFVG